MPLCLMENVRKAYRMGEEDVEVLRGVNLSVEPGEFVAVMGTSGSGKTTLMNILGCLDTPTSGRYVLSGREVSRMSDDELSEARNCCIGFVFQSFYLLPYATALENVLLPTLYRPAHTEKADKKARGLLDMVGIADRAGYRPPQLSGGQQQRVAIARALMNDPDLLLADEPTGQLDSSTAREIMELLSRMNERGKTVVLVTHDEYVASYARRRILIHDGVVG